MNDTFKINISVFLILRKADKILLYKRINTKHEAGNYSLVGGHVDGNETVQQAIAREAQEEIGIRINTQDLTVAHVIHTKATADYGEYINFFLESSVWDGEPANMESNRCEELVWHTLESLPVNTVQYVRQALENIQQGIFFSNFGW